MKLLLVVISFFAISSTVEALLPPFYESKKELLAILNDDELSTKLQSGELITGIQRNDEGFEIQTNKHTLQVDIHYLSTGRIGPAEFVLNFHEAAPLSK